MLLLLGLILAVILSWHFSSYALVPDHSPYTEDVEIEAVSADRITLSRSETTARPGYYGLAWQAGHAIVGPIQSQDADSVTRRLSAVRGYLVSGAEAGLESSVYAGDPGEARGLPYRSVDVPDSLGPMPAWLVPAAGAPGLSSGPRTWAIVVHGHNDSRQAGLRISPTLRRAGLSTLLISYRNDLGAPESPDGLYHLGETEWQDLEAAARYARRHGARRLVLIGYSMAP